ncbi:MAG: 3-isopropylmalate dehydratase large subunit [Deltaproteobacteria bacterium]|nr:3-isopropylmalate dehydratase large subunit [Deltaproteobacteria bacterium]
MGMTITEKILAAHAGLDKVEPGELIEVSVDFSLANDITAPIAIERFRQAGAEKIYDVARIALVPDHFVPNKDIESAAQCQLLREFALEHELPYYYEVGRMGIEHALLPEQGLVLPGDVVVGADSHTCTYGGLGAFATGVGSTNLRPWVTGKDLILYTIGQIGVDGARYRAMEFTGPVIAQLSMDQRLTMANMAIEAGAKNGIIAPDECTRAFVEERAQRSYKFYQSDADAQYEQVITYNVSEIEPQVALPPSPANSQPVSSLDEIPIDQVVIGSCTNGRIEDLRLAAQLLKSRRVAPRVRCLIIPATQAIYRQAMDEGLFTIFLEAEAAISTPTCGPCLGGHMGILAAGERAVATTNRNFVGRMGHPESEVYLASPAVAAASAVLGRIASPEEL